MDDDRRSPGQLLAENLRSLMEARRDLATIEAVARATELKGGLKVSKSTVGRLVHAEVPFNLSGLHALAKVFGVSAWQLIAPDLGYGLHRIVGDSPTSMRLAPVEVPELLLRRITQKRDKGMTSDKSPQLPSETSAVTIVSGPAKRQHDEVAASRARKATSEAKPHVSPRRRPVPAKR